MAILRASKNGDAHCAHTNLWHRWHAGVVKNFLNLACILPVMLTSTWLQAQEQSAQNRFVDQLFDKPLHKQTLPVPANPEKHGKGTLTCFYYPYLMIKEAIYDDHVGAGLLSITYLRKGKAPPSCQFDRAEDEGLIQDWGGNFLGVKGGYVFFSGAGCCSGSGSPFAVYKNRRRVFADSGVLHSIELSKPVHDPDNGHWYTNPLLLRYHRSYLAPCSMRADEKACWSAIQRVTGLTQAAPPDCGAAYEIYEKGASPSEVAPIRYGPSYIDYDVETTLDDQSIIRVTPIGSVGKCYPAP
jgi:hypothetical protein